MEADTSPSSITSLSAVELSEAIKKRQFRCTDVMEAYLDRIEKLNPIYNAIVALADRDKLMDQSEAADAALDKNEYWGWMHGFPHAVKDLADAKGFVTTKGLTVAPKVPASQDSIFVERIRNAGAILIGKTNVPEMGFGSQSYNRVYGTTLNAYDTRLTAGGWFSNPYAPRCGRQRHDGFVAQSRSVEQRHWVSAQSRSNPVGCGRPLLSPTRQQRPDGTQRGRHHRLVQNDGGL
jgi:hypothetical protein